MKELDKSLVERVGFNPYYQVRGHRDDIDLASNNYLGLAADDRLKAAAKEAVDRYGTSMCGTPAATGYIDLFQRLEERLCRFIGLEEALLFPSCYQANSGIFALLADRQDVIIIDRDAHSSLMQGVMAARCKISPFLHHNMDHLETILRRSGGCRKKFVVTESVFSTEGSIAPFDQLTQLCEQYGAIPVVDDSHGIGVLGARGGGVLEHFHIRQFNGIYTASLGKALANSGGLVAGSGQVIEYLRYQCPHLIYSTAVTPATLGGLEGALRVIATDFERLSAVMWSYKRQMTERIAPLLSGQAPISAIPTGSAEKAIRLVKQLSERGVLATPFIEPSVSRNRCVVRLIAGAGLSAGQVDQAIDAVRESLAELAL